MHCPTCQVSTPAATKSQEKESNDGSDGHIAQQLFSTPVAFEGSDNIFVNFKSELKVAMNDIMVKMHQEFQLLREDMGVRISNLEKRISVIEENQQRLKSPSPSIHPDVEKMINQLKSDLNDREQELLSNDIDISNLPEASGENVLHTALLVASTLGLNIDERDIVSAERVGARRINATESSSTPGLLPVRPRSLVVRLARRGLRDQWLANARSRRGATSADLKLPGPPVRFFVNERLTKQNKQLFRMAREIGNRLGWKYVWTKRGRILARQKPGDSVSIIRTEADIQQVFGMQNV